MQGVLIALDKIRRKVEALHSICQTMGLDCVKTFVCDSTKSVAPATGPDWSPPYAPDTFDRVLLDAPCSATGQRPRIGKQNISEKQIESFPKLQKKLFVSVSKYIFFLFNVCIQWNGSVQKHFLYNFKIVYCKAHIFM